MVGLVLLIFSVFCVVLLCVFTLLVPCCYVRYDFRIKTMFGSSFPSVVCRTAHCFIYVMFGSSFLSVVCRTAHCVIYVMFGSSFPSVVCRTAHCLIYVIFGSSFPSVVCRTAHCFIYVMFGSSFPSVVCRTAQCLIYVMFGSSFPSVVCRTDHCFIYVIFNCLHMCCIFVLFVFVFCRVYPMLPVSLDSPFLIARSGFSNVYLQTVLNEKITCQRLTGK